MNRPRQPRRGPCLRQLRQCGAGADLHGCVFNHPDWRNLDLSNVDFANATVNNGELGSATLCSATFAGATDRRGDFYNTKDVCNAHNGATALLPARSSQPRTSAHAPTHLDGGYTLLMRERHAQTVRADLANRPNTNLVLGVHFAKPDNNSDFTAPELSRTIASLIPQ